MSIKRITLIIFVFILTVGLLELVSFSLGRKDVGNITVRAFSIAEIIMLVFLIKEGTLIKKKLLAKLAFTCIVFIIISSLMKILHWQYGNVLLLMGTLGIPVVYGIHFYQKEDRKLLDILKFIWVVLGSISLILPERGFPQVLLVMGICNLILFLVISFLFMREGYSTDRPKNNS